MSDIKYIIIEIDGEKVPVIFGKKLSHKAVFRGIQQGLRMDIRENGNGGSWAVEPVSAGFVEGLVVSNVTGYSESMRYGYDHIEREFHHLTEAHPETDLPIINGNRTVAQTVAALADKQQADSLSNEVYVAKILTKQAPEARHKSPPHRWDAAVKYLTDKGYTAADAKAIVIRVATEKCPGAYKIA